MFLPRVFTCLHTAGSAECVLAAAWAHGTVCGHFPRLLVLPSCSVYTSGEPSSTRTLWSTTAASGRYSPQRCSLFFPPSGGHEIRRSFRIAHLRASSRAVLQVRPWQCGCALFCASPPPPPPPRLAPPLLPLSRVAGVWLHVAWTTLTPSLLLAGAFLCHERLWFAATHWSFAMAPSWGQFAGTATPVIGAVLRQVFGFAVVRGVFVTDAPLPSPSPSCFFSFILPVLCPPWVSLGGALSCRCVLFLFLLLLLLLLRLLLLLLLLLRVWHIQVLLVRVVIKAVLRTLVKIVFGVDIASPAPDTVRPCIIHCNVTREFYVDPVGVVLRCCTDRSVCRRFACGLGRELKVHCLRCTGLVYRTLRAHAHPQPQHGCYVVCLACSQKSCVRGVVLHVCPVHVW